MKILVVGLTGGVGGVENFICNLYESIDTTKYCQEFLVHQEVNEIYRDRIAKKEGVIYSLPGIKKNPILFLYNIFQFYKIHRDVDVVHLHECTATFFVYALPLIFFNDIKLIVHSHNGEGGNFLHFLLRGVQNRRADKKLACSNIAAEWMYGKNAKNVKIIHNGIDTTKYAFNPEVRRKVRKNLGISQKTILIGSVARFEIQKNHGKIISVFYDYHKHNKDCKLILVGTGSEQKRIETIIAELGLKEDVIILKNRTDVNELLMAFDVFLMPSLYEGLPFVSLEAQASGLPLVISDTVSRELDITDLVIRVGLNNENHDWIKAIESMIGKRALDSSDMYASQIKLSGYDLFNTAHEMENVYSSLL